MIFFNTIKINLAMCLYYPDQTRIFDEKRLLVMIIYFSAIGSVILFALFEAKIATDYVISMFAIVSALGSLISFVDTSIKTKNIFSLIDKLEDITKERKHWQPLVN